MELEHKYSRLNGDLKVTDGHVIEGYASYFDKVDQGNDVVKKGAYSASLAAIQAKGENVKLLWQHDPAFPIGIWDEVRETERGLWVKGRILPDVEKGREAIALIEAGAIDGLSIGYRTVKSSKNAHGQRQLTEVELWEVSLVTFPMLPQARVGAKHNGILDAELRSIAAGIREASQLLVSR